MLRPARVRRVAPIGTQLYGYKEGAYTPPERRTARVWIPEQIQKLVYSLPRWFMGEPINSEE